MSRALLTSLFFCSLPSASATAQATLPMSPTLAGLAAGARSDSAGTSARFWSDIRQGGSPLVEPIPGDSANLLVTFLYRGDTATRNVVLFRGPRVTQNIADNPFARLEATNIWYRSYVVRRDARFTYLVGANVDLSPQDSANPGELFRRLRAFGLDSLNPRRDPPPGDPLPRRLPPFHEHSAVELPDAPAQPWVAARPGVPAGKVEKFKLQSTLLKNERDIAVYTPPGYDRSAAPLGLLIVFDGEWYLTLVPTPTILDNMLADRKIPPLVAVFVDNPARGAELHCNPAFADFLATELVAWIRERYSVTDDPARTTLTGSSAGGLASTCAALAHPERFGNVLSQSGAFWWRPMTAGEEPEWVLRQVQSGPRRPVRFYLNIGRFEDVAVLDGRTMLSVNHHLRDALRARGYEVHFTEFTGGHEYLNWKGMLSDGLMALLGPSR